MYNSEEGIKGEIAAQKYLIDLGWKIVATNANFHLVGEIDIVAYDGQTLVFVEVRTRSDNRYGHPFETVTKAKQRKIVAASRRFIMENKPKCQFFRYDVIAVLHGKIEHLRNAFEAC